jgi:hypothetical protein
MGNNNLALIRGYQREDLRQIKIFSSLGFSFGAKQTRLQNETFGRLDGFA